MSLTVKEKLQVMHLAETHARFTTKDPVQVYKEMLLALTEETALSAQGEKILDQVKKVGDDILTQMKGRGRSV